MQEIKKRTIVIASILKPIDDTRMFEKMGQSLAIENYVTIIGYPSTIIPTHATITFYPLQAFKRLSFKRLMIPWQILKIIFRLNPSVIIITTHELLMVAVLAKIFITIKIVYDVRENYFRNILHTTAFAGILRPFIAYYVRSIEWLTSPFIDHFFLAEKGYENEISFPGKRKTILENKFKRPDQLSLSKKSKEDGNLHFIFSGTLADTTGVFVALELIQKLFQIDATVRLTVCGYCAQPEVLKKIKNSITDKPYVNLIGGDKLVPHQFLIKEIQRADVGIISYIINPATTHAIPTKLYEYLGCELPILLIDHPPWIDRCKYIDAAVPFNVINFNASEVLKEIKTKSFYTSQAENIFWEDEAVKMVRVIDSFF